MWSEWERERLPRSCPRAVLGGMDEQHHYIRLPPGSTSCTCKPTWAAISQPKDRLKSFVLLLLLPGRIRSRLQVGLRILCTSVAVGKHFWFYCDVNASSRQTNTGAFGFAFVFAVRRRNDHEVGLDGDKYSLPSPSCH